MFEARSWKLEGQVERYLRAGLKAGFILLEETIGNDFLRKRGVKPGQRLGVVRAPDGWVALQKGEVAVGWAAIQAAGLASGRLADNKELRFDDRYYGTRFVVRADARPSGRKGRR